MDDLERAVASMRTEMDSLNVNMQQAQRALSDHGQRLDTLQTPLWKRMLFRVDGWPGQKDLNADRPAWRPWRRWWTS